jgi:glycosyltransferase involved in cell wall biosynthesis
MRIAIVNRHLRDGAGGSELQCDLIARGLAARGHHVVHLVTSQGTADLTGLPYRCVRVGAGEDAVIEALVAEEVDVAYWRLNRLGLPAFVAGCRRAGVPVVFATSSNDDVARWPQEGWPGPREVGLRDHAAQLRWRVVHRLGHRALRDVDVLTVQREDFLGRAPTRRQVVVRNSGSSDADRTTFSWPRPYVAWVANMKRRKRPELLPAIADRLAVHGVDVLFAGALRDDRYASLLQPGAAANLHYLGVLDRSGVGGLLAAARCVAVTSEEEGFSNVLIHAWSLGVPTVTLEHDPDGLIGREGLGAMACGDVERFLDALQQYATDGERSARAGERASALARVLFDPEANLDRLEDALRTAGGGAAEGR